jgi:hypothetical protein
MPDGNGTSWTPGLVARLSNVCLIEGVKVGGTIELVPSVSTNKDDVPASPFSSSGILTVATGSSSLAVVLSFLPFFEADPPTLYGEMANVWQGE